MDSRTKEVNRVVSQYDKYLFAKRENNGAVHIYRRTLRPADPYHFIMAVTDNWSVHGTPRDWGLEVIIARLTAHDLWKNETILDRLEKEEAKIEESKERYLKNNVESFLYDFRRQFARATNEINTSSLEKLDPRAKKGA